MRHKQWLNLRLTEKAPTPREIWSHLLEDFQYDPEFKSGIEFWSCSPRQITGAYLDNFQVETLIADEEGHPKKVTQTKITKTPFKWFMNEGLLEVESINNAKSTQHLTSKLAQATDFNLVVSNIEPPVIDWLEKIREHMDYLTVSSVRASGVSINAETSANIVLKGQNALEHMKQFTTLDKVNLIHFCCGYPHRSMAIDLKSKIQITSLGSVYFEEEGMPTELKDILKKTILEFKKD